MSAFLPSPAQTEIATTPVDNAPGAIEPRSNPDQPELASISRYDAWVLARVRAGIRLEDGFRKLSGPLVALVKEMDASGPDVREEAWQDHLASLGEKQSESLILAVASANPHNPAPVDESWERPVAFKLPEVQPFPIEILPEPMSRMIREGSRAIGCPVDFLGLPALVVAGAAIGRTVRLKLKEGYHVSASIYSACVGQPGDGKSPALGLVVRPLQRVDQDSFDLWKAAMESFESRKNESSPSPKSGRSHRRPSNAREGNRATSNQQQSAAERSEASHIDEVDEPIRLEPPTLERHIVRDTTVEALVAVLEQNPRGLLMVLDEASSLAASMNQYKGGKGSDRQYYLTMWSGEPISVDRKTNSDLVPIRVPQPFLCIAGMMVPDMIGAFVEAGGRHDGFLDRFLFAYPDPVPKAGWSEFGVSEAAASGWAALLGRLLDRVMTSDGTKPVAHVIRLGREAESEWRSLINGHHSEQNSSDFERLAHWALGEVRSVRWTSRADLTPSESSC